MFAWLAHVLAFAATEIQNRLPRIVFHDVLAVCQPKLMLEQGRHPFKLLSGGTCRVVLPLCVMVLEELMANEKGPNIKKKQKCKNCEGKGTLKKGDKVVKCQRCGGSGLR